MSSVNKIKEAIKKSTSLGKLHVGFSDAKFSRVPIPSKMLEQLTEAAHHMKCQLAELRIQNIELVDGDSSSTAHKLVREVLEKGASSLTIVAIVSTSAKLMAKYTTGYWLWEKKATHSAWQALADIAKLVEPTNGSKLTTLELDFLEDCPGDSAKQLEVCRMTLLQAIAKSNTTLSTLHLRNGLRLNADEVAKLVRNLCGTKRLTTFKSLTIGKWISMSEAELWCRDLPVLDELVDPMCDLIEKAGSKLTTLVLDGTSIDATGNFGDRSIERLGTAIKSPNCKLEWLSLRRCSVSTSAMKAFAEVIKGSNISLQKLGLSADETINRFTPDNNIPLKEMRDQNADAFMVRSQVDRNPSPLEEIVMETFGFGKSREQTMAGAGSDLQTMCEKTIAKFARDLTQYKQDLQTAQQDVPKLKKAHDDEWTINWDSKQEKKSKWVSRQEYARRQDERIKGLEANLKALRVTLAKLEGAAATVNEAKRMALEAARSATEAETIAKEAMKLVPDLYAEATKTAANEAQKAAEAAKAAAGQASKAVADADKSQKVVNGWEVNDLATLTKAGDTTNSAAQNLKRRVDEEVSKVSRQSQMTQEAKEKASIAARAALKKAADEKAAAEEAAAEKAAAEKKAAEEKAAAERKAAEEKAAAERKAAEEKAAAEKKAAEEKAAAERKAAEEKAAAEKKAAEEEAAAEKKVQEEAKKAEKAAAEKGGIAAFFSAAAPMKKVATEEKATAGEQAAEKTDEKKEKASWFGKKKKQDDNAAGTPGNCSSGGGEQQGSPGSSDSNTMSA